MVIYAATESFNIQRPVTRALHGDSTASPKWHSSPWNLCGMSGHFSQWHLSQDVFFECVSSYSTTFVCFPDSSFWRAFHELETHYILEFLMFHFFAEKIYSFSTTGGFFPRSSLKMINTNKYLCCRAGKRGSGGVQIEHQRDYTTMPS